MIRSILFASVKENNATRPPHTAAYHPASVWNARNWVSRSNGNGNISSASESTAPFTLTLSLCPSLSLISISAMQCPCVFPFCWWLYSWRHFQFSIELSKHVILHICLRWLKGNVKSKTVQTNSRNTKGGWRQGMGMVGWKSNFLIEIGFFAIDCEWELGWMDSILELNLHWGQGLEWTVYGILSVLSTFLRCPFSRCRTMHKKVYSIHKFFEHIFYKYYIIFVNFGPSGSSSYEDNNHRWSCEMI